MRRSGFKILRRDDAIDMYSSAADLKFKLSASKFKFSQMLAVNRDA
ncbi:hypothetical protein [uncultured Campylobacter sp.]|nr:hypothetical protein [uncultured Campylobacter sp.]